MHQRSRMEADWNGGLIIIVRRLGVTYCAATNLAIWRRRLIGELSKRPMAQLVLSRRLLSRSHHIGSQKMFLETFSHYVHPIGRRNHELQRGKFRVRLSCKTRARPGCVRRTLPQQSFYSFLDFCGLWLAAGSWEVTFQFAQIRVMIPLPRTTLQTAFLG